MHTPKSFVITLREKRVPKRRPWGTIATNGTLFSKGHSFFLNNHVYEKNETVSLGHCGTEIVPQRVPYYGQSNSAPRGTISVPFFFWVQFMHICILIAINPRCVHQIYALSCNSQAKCIHAWPDNNKICIDKVPRLVYTFWICKPLLDSSIIYPTTLVPKSWKLLMWYHSRYQWLLCCTIAAIKAAGMV